MYTHSNAISQALPLPLSPAVPAASLQPSRAGIVRWQVIHHHPSYKNCQYHSFPFASIKDSLEKWGTLARFSSKMGEGVPTVWDRVECCNWKFAKKGVMFFHQSEDSDLYKGRKLSNRKMKKWHTVTFF